MELIEFNTENISIVTPGLPVVNVNANSGYISINKTAAEKLNISTGDNVKLFHEKQDPLNWYIEKVKDENGFLLRLEKKYGSSLRISSKQLAKTIAEKFSANTSVRFIVAGKPTVIEKRTLYGLCKSNVN